MTNTYPALNIDQLAAVAKYIRKHGRTWKSQLLNDWMNGKCQGELQQIRNSHGPSWLKNFNSNILR